MLDRHHFATLNELIYLGIDHQSWVANILKETTRSYVLSDKKNRQNHTVENSSEHRIQFLQQINYNKLRDGEETYKLNQ